MRKLMRVSFTIEESLYQEMEKLVQEGNYANRSEWIRDLVRERLVKDSWKNNEEAVGTITLVYEHERRDLSGRLTQLQHSHHHAILATTHVHLTHDLCVEMVMARGRAQIIESLADEMRCQKGVLHVSVSMSTTGKRLV
ncbi:MAG: nickel-responsive transcriptional regulator NikR [Candidatus Hydrogenedentes bacterium]|jgi:CopG family nickel-responsive transcriptional regulator|nr:nickel-responsive transcriptional regulator NikR [Candidatus Hydrogenedentota bacterium]